jgi:hypothetical protein
LWLGEGFHGLWRWKQHSPQIPQLEMAEVWGYNCSWVVAVAYGRSSNGTACDQHISLSVYMYIYIYHITSSSASAVRIHLRSGNCCHPQHPLLSTFSKADLQMCVCVSETGAGRPPKRFNQIIFWWVRSWIIDQWINDDLSCFQTCHQDLRHRLDWPRSSFFFVSPSWSSALNISWFCPKIQNMSAILLGQIELRGSLFSDQPRMVVSGW